MLCVCVCVCVTVCAHVCVCACKCTCMYTCLLEKIFYTNNIVFKYHYIHYVGIHVCICKWVPIQLVINDQLTRPVYVQMLWNTCQ